jgi:AraC family transcriptional regulator of adaptative response/methylated-DNA-[protein]-cysteine methyltransferase
VSAIELLREPSLESAHDYARVAKAIGFLREHQFDQPDLAAVAQHVHLTEFHFQRLFSRWAGVSPKRFLQFLTIEHARHQLATSKAVLEASLDSGLSGPGRLHDLFVNVEAVTPGEFKTGGAGVTIDYGFHPTPFGECLLGTTPRGVCWLSFLEGESRNEAVAALREKWSGANLRQSKNAPSPLIEQIFRLPGSRKRGALSLLLMGTNWQIKVWEALLRIPRGALTSYQTIAGVTGARSASRAVGNAVAGNVIAYLIPCHRVIRETGVIGDYKWGSDRKRAIIGWEASRDLKVA